MPIDLVYDHRQEQFDEKAREEERLGRWQAELVKGPASPSEVEAYNRRVVRYNAALEEYSRRPVLEFQVGEHSHKVESPSGRLTDRRISLRADRAGRGGPGGAEEGVRGGQAGRGVGMRPRCSPYMLIVVQADSAGSS